MARCVTALILAVMAAAPTLALGDEVRSGDHVEATAAFFMCGAREDLATIDALDRGGDRQAAIKVGMQRCESGRRAYKYVVAEVNGNDLCIRSESAPYCMWAHRSALQLTPSQ
jgi:hypothetical protein